MIRLAARVATFALLAIALALAGCTRAAPSRAAGTIAPTGIDSSGRLDDTGRLQALIDNVPEGSTIVFPAGGRYRVEGTIHVKNRTDLTIDGNGSMFFATTKGDRTRSVWSFEGGSNIVVRNVVVKGANPHGGMADSSYQSKLEAQHAFNIVSTNRIELDHVSATDLYGDFVYIGKMAKGGLAKGVYIHDSTFSRNGRQGISLTGVDGVRIIGNTISDVRRATFDLEPNGSQWGVFNVDIEHNTIGSGRLYLIASGGVGPVSGITFAHNTINRGAIMVVKDRKGGRRGPFTITDNVATGTWGGAAGDGMLNFYNVDGLTVTGNTLPLQANRGDVGVKATGSCNVVVSNNTFKNAVAPVIVAGVSSCSSAASPSSSPSPSAVSPTASASAVPTHTAGSVPAPGASAATPAAAAPRHAPSHAAVPIVRSSTPSRPKPSHRTPAGARPTVVVAAGLPAAVSAGQTLRNSAFGGTADTTKSGGALSLGLLAASCGAGVVGFRRRPLVVSRPSGGAQHRSGRSTIGGTVDILPRHRAH